METKKKQTVEIKDKVLLTVDEASMLFNINTSKIRELSDGDDCKFVLWNGNKRLLKRKEFEDFLCNSFSI